MSLALLFPGQGLQHAAMLPWLDAAPEAAPLLARLALAVGADWRHRLADEAWAERNDVAQCLVTATSLAAWAVLRARGLPAPAVCAGYSVGELAAFSAAGVFDAATALSLAGTRAAAMDASAGGRDAGLLAVSGPAASRGASAWGEGVEVAIQIAPDRCILGGDAAALHAAAQRLTQQGALVSRLRVRVASHTSQMQAAAAALAAVLAPMAWQTPRCALVVNLDGTAVRELNKLKHCLAAQLAQTVQWQRALQTVAERRPRCVLEMGAGNALSRSWLAAHPDVASRSIDEFHSAESVVAWVTTHLRA